MMNRLLIALLLLCVAGGALAEVPERVAPAKAARPGQIKALFCEAAECGSLPTDPVDITQGRKFGDPDAIECKRYQCYRCIWDQAAFNYLCTPGRRGGACYCQDGDYCSSKGKCSIYY